MLENVLEVGQQPEALIVYASLGKAARDWPAYRAIHDALQKLEETETLVIQSGKPVAILPTPATSPLVVIATNNMVGRYATPEVFYERMAAGQTIWGGLTAGAWQYIGSQGVLQGIYEVFRAAARDPAGRLHGELRRRFILTSGLGGMGSAQPVAIRMTGAVGLIVEVDRERVRARLAAGVVDEAVDTVEEALRAVRRAQEGSRGWAVALRGNAAEVYPELVRRGVTPDLVTDLTAAHDARYGYVPAGLEISEWVEMRDREPDRVIDRARTSMAAQLRAMRAMQAAGAVVFENGNNLRVQAQSTGVTDAFEIPGFVERYIRPLFCRGIGPFRWVALSGDRADADRLDALASSLFPERPEVASWLELARRHMPVEGLPARSCWLGHGERSRLALAVNQLVAQGELSAPVLFSRDHLDAAGMTHPFIGTERMRDGSDAVADWPLLDAMLLCSTGADLVAVHAGGGGYSGLMQSAGVSLVADGSPSAAQRLRAALDADTGLGVVRYAEAGYELAATTAAETGIRRIIPQ